MSARLPRSKGPSTSLSKSSDEYKKQRCQTTRTVVQQSSSQQPVHDHPWAGLGEALLKPLPAEWRYNIQRAFSQIGEALGQMFNQQGRAQPRGRRGI